MVRDIDARHVLGSYSLGTVTDITPLVGVGGFSGARLWRVESEAQTYCLRRWPEEHPDEGRLRFIHAVMQQLRAAGLPFIPQIHPTRDGRTYVRIAGHLWELTDWMPGEANFRSQPSDAKLVAAMSALARIHRAAEPLLPRMPNGPSEAAYNALRRSEQLQHGLAKALTRAVDSRHGPEIGQLITQILQHAQAYLPLCHQLLHRVRNLSCPQQPCLRDIWHAHVLFRNDLVSGFIDFGAARYDNVACDVARLLTSLVDHDCRMWPIGLEAYQGIRPLDGTERQLLAALHVAGSVLSGTYWAEWLFLENRHFDARNQVVRRLSELVTLWDRHTGWPLLL